MILKVYDKKMSWHHHHNVCQCKTNNTFFLLILYKGKKRKRAVLFLFAFNSFMECAKDSIEDTSLFPVVQSAFSESMMEFVIFDN